MLEQLLVTDFQRHREFRLRFGPGVSCLVGPSDSGKSALIRAVEWVAFNTPAGTAFVRHGATAARAALKVDGRWVVRHRSKSENVYELDGEVFTSQTGSAFPPPAVSALLNLGPVNVQGQHAPLFWIADTPGQAARSLNAVIDLSEIDAVTDAAAAAVRKAKTAVELTESRHADAVKRESETVWAVSFDAVLTAVEKSHQMRQDAAARAAGLAAVLAGIDRQTHALHAAALAAAAGELAAETGRDAIRAGNRAGDLHGLMGQARHLSRDAAADPGPAFAALSRLRADGDAVAERRRAVEHLLADADKAEDERWRNEGEAARLTAELAAVGVCPLCGQAADTSQLSSPTSTCRPSAPGRGRNPGSGGLTL